MTINIFFLIMAIFLFCKIVDGYKKGMVREVLSFVSMLFLCIVIVLVGNGLKSYLRGEFLNAVVVVVLLAVLSIVHHFVSMITLPAKLVSKLPVVHALDKLLGAVVGAAETVLVLWTVYTFIMMVNIGMAGTFLRQCIADSTVLTWFYERNQLAVWLERLGAELNIRWHM